MNINYHIVPRDTDCPPFAFWDDGFTRQELDELQMRASTSAIQASVGGGNGAENVVNDDIRRSSISWVSSTQESVWLFDRLSILISTLNSKFYRFDLRGFGENIQLTNYDSRENGTYNWHIDRGGSNSSVRKMSAVLQLSEPGEYDGGELELLHTTPDPIRVEKKRGRLIIFPSYTIHRVTPVTKGTRQSLVVWLYGDPLR